MKNICLLIDSFAGGGAEKVTLNLAEALVKMGHHVDIIVFTNVMGHDPLHGGFNIHMLNSSHFAKSNTILKSILKKIRQFLISASFIIKMKRLRHLLLKKEINCLLSKVAELNSDLFIANLSHTNLICIEAKLPNLYCCMHRGISMEINSRYQSKIIRKIKTAIAQQIYNNQNLIGVSDGVVKDFLERVNIKPKSAQTIYNLFNFERIRDQAQEYGVAEKDYIIAVGRLSREKRFDVLINAYKQANVQQKLLIFGQGPEFNNINNLIVRLGLQEQVILKGFHPNPYPYIKNAKCLILSSDMEGLPTVLIEALILAVPVVSTDCPFGPSEILIDELASFLSPVEDVSALADNIKKMLQNPVVISDKYIKNFDKDETIKQYLSLCQ